MPLGSMTKPEPSEDILCARGAPLLKPWFLKNWSNMSSKGVPFGKSGIGSAPFSSTVWVAEMLTTASATLSTRSARLVGRACAKAGAARQRRRRADRHRRDGQDERRALEAGMGRRFDVIKTHGVFSPDSSARRRDYRHLGRQSCPLRGETAPPRSLRAAFARPRRWPPREPPRPGRRRAGARGFAARPRPCACASPR